MGIGNLSVGSLALIFLITIVMFGTKKLRHAGKDIVIAIKSLQHELGKNKNEE